MELVKILLRLSLGLGSVYSSNRLGNSGVICDGRMEMTKRGLVSFNFSSINFANPSLCNGMGL
ncbi:hypothetical protein Fmac_002291 [Flemingia macrophylla]|uniref:Uncharacterized protein n=1 Tax=Flemingia macrophylla TaxID=520843 RepID=A0ABD1NJM4_9FABA